MEIKTVASLVEAVLLRPKMYTMRGTFEEVIAFLEGYYSGVAKANPYAPAVVDWTHFQHWLAQNLNVEPSELFLRFLECCPNNQEALDKMREWFLTFQQGNAQKETLASSQA